MKPPRSPDTVEAALDEAGARERQRLHERVVDRQAGGRRLRVPIGVIGPRAATATQRETAVAIGAGLAALGLSIVCGGREGVMEGVAEGAARHGGLTIGLLPDTSPDLANPWLTQVIATGLGEARNAIIARSAFCLIAIGNSHGTLSEVALGLHFGKRIFGLDGAVDLDGVSQRATADEVIDEVAALVLGWGGD